MKYIHVNCDLGEGGEQDDELMSMITACSIACGGHAGTLEIMHQTVAHAMKNDVEIGAHPSYPDKNNFGRISLEMEPQDLKQSLVAQILSLKQIAEAEGGFLSHVKPHGALYNDAAKDEAIANIVIDSILEFEEKFPLFAPENSVIARLAKGKLPVIFEVFADRNYMNNYQLVDRSKPGAVITRKEEVFDHVFSMISEGKITCNNGVKIPCNPATFCLHSDTPNAVENLKFMHRKLEEKGVKIKRS